MSGKNGVRRVLRGGSCIDDATCLRADRLDWGEPEVRVRFDGFRLVIAVVRREKK